MGLQASVSHMHDMDFDEPSTSAVLHKKKRKIAEVGSLQNYSLINPMLSSKL